MFFLILSFSWGQDVGLAAFIGATSAGVASWLGNKVPFLQAVEGNYLANVSRRAAIGAIVGGTVSSTMGGSFGRGARYGAMTSAIAYTANEWLHRETLEKIKRWLGGVFEGTRYGGGAGGKAKLRLGPFKIEGGIHNITGRMITPEGIEYFYEEKIGASVEAFNVNLSTGITNGEGSFRPIVEIGKVSISDLISIEIGSTIPHPYSGAAINLELHIHFDKIFGGGQ